MYKHTTHIYLYEHLWKIGQLNFEINKVGYEERLTIDRDVTYH
jgi:hypothetical protein